MKLMVVDEHEIFRKGLTNLLEQESDIEVVNNGNNQWVNAV